VCLQYNIIFKYQSQKAWFAVTVKAVEEEEILIAGDQKKQGGLLIVGS
jgi:hypothetical protein